MHENCFICGSDDFKTRLRVARLRRTIDECRKCGLVQIHPRSGVFNFVDDEDRAKRDAKLESLFSEMKRGVACDLGSVMEKETKVRRAFFKRRLDAILKYKTSGKLLDVGCAQGIFLSAAQGAGFDLKGVEPSKHTARLAQRNAPGARVINSTLVEARFSDDEFDVAVLLNTIEHLMNPVETVAEVNRILKPGGLFVVETPDVEHWIPRLLGPRWVQFLVPDHVAFFSKKTLSNLLKEAGFEVMEIRPADKVLSLRLITFHLSRYTGRLALLLMKALEGTGLAGLSISMPQRDAMIVIAQKTRSTSKTGAKT